MRVQAPLVMAAAVLLHFDWRRSLAAALSVVGFSLPLILKTLSGEIQGRFQMLSLLSDSHVRNFGEPTLGLKLELLLESFQVHFNPAFLLFKGDGNLRHSTQRVGEWSALDVAGVLILAAVLIARWQSKSGAFSRNRVFTLCLWGYLCGVLPAVMTWEGTPHALRAIGAWPFLSLLAGLGPAELPPGRASRVVQAVCLALTASFSVYFLSDYFLRYPERSRDWFDVSGVEQLRNPGGPHVKNYPDLAAKYFDLVYRNIDRCP
jgi:hypothetical protein